jgi:hypothetical protein
MVVLELVPLACEALLRRVDAKEQRSLAQLPAATFDLQRGSGALGEGREHVTSVFLTPDRVRVPSGARPSEPRPQRFDGLLRFGEDELVVVIEASFPHTPTTTTGFGCRNRNGQCMSRGTTSWATGWTSTAWGCWPPRARDHPRLLRFRRGAFRLAASFSTP